MKPTFENFWQKYPRKVKKPYAAKCWKKLNPDKKLFDKIMTALDWQIPLWAEAAIKWTPHPSTYINNAMWNDTKEEPATPKPEPISLKQARKNAGLE